MLWRTYCLEMIQSNIRLQLNDCIPKPTFHRILKSKPLYFNNSRRRNHSSFHHWNRENIKLNLDCRKTETVAFRIFSLAVQIKLPFVKASKCQSDSFLSAEVFWLSGQQMGRIYNSRKIPATESQACHSSDIQPLPIPEYLSHMFLLINQINIKVPHPILYVHQ